MDAAKVSFLFGPDLEEPHTDDDDGEFLTGDDDQAPPTEALLAVVAQQIINGDPPLVWETAQRLLRLGLNHRWAMNELGVALNHAIQTGPRAASPPDSDVYAEALSALPLPTADEIEAASLHLHTTAAPIAARDLGRLLRAHLGRPDPDPLGDRTIDRVLDRLLDDGGPLALLAGDRVVHVGDLTSGAVLTHRLNEWERDQETLTVDFDLAAFARDRGLRLRVGPETLALSAGQSHRSWHGPPGWLNRYDGGALLAVTVNITGEVTIDALPEEPPAAPELVALIRAVYDHEVAEPWMPVAAADLVIGALASDPTAFDRPQPPLGQLCVAAGLERRGSQVAHTDSVWAAEHQMRRAGRIFRTLAGQEQREAAATVLALADHDQPTPDALREALDELGDPDVANVVIDELVATGRAPQFSGTLLDAAETPRHIGAARFVAALVAEQAGEVHVADAQLHLALQADPHAGPIIERCAWYASDRGNATEAVRLWHQLGDDHSDDINTVEPFARRLGPKVGRNDPCWCGSGRKYKMCHPGQHAPAPLPERIGWLCRKAIAYLEHSPDAQPLVMTLSQLRAATADQDGLLDAAGDPIVLDTALTEGGWFARFVDDRGPLLPDDEALLAATWTLVPRTVYEVVDVNPGATVRVRDLSTGDIFDIRERTFSRQARPETFICGRAVPDGAGHQFIGGMFPVAPGTERRVLGLCDDADPEAICDHVASLHRPPVLLTREGEPLVRCSAVLQIPDRHAAETVLDEHYRRDGDRWVEMHTIDDHEQILRATLTLKASRLEIETHSQARVDRVLRTLLHDLPAARLVSNDRNPLTAAAPTTPVAPSQEVQLDPEMLAQIQELFERRWIDESVPALDGLTPRQASQDPSRRDELRRLIASFPTPDRHRPNSSLMRPARLRELLNLEPTADR